ncbi:MAG: FAD-binding oxidoreductase, partial [Gammaproteobacteria bacterium]|nr:FAD-binding oxidoreductase [Gammaproteobacteria bacterium]
MSAVPAAVLDRLRAIVGSDGAVTGADCDPYLIDERGRYCGNSSIVLRPATVQQVATVVAVCAHERIGIVPQGGNTGLVGGSVPDASGDQVVVSTTRLDRVRAIDADNFTISVDAGCILESVQAAAAAVDRLFPLSLASEGSCRIGGTISTNAGGTGVIRYGNMRELVLGLEVVLPSGEVWDGMHGLRKNNTGYDLKQLFIGAEGTLGIVTGATLRLFPQPTETTTYFIAVRDVGAAIEVLADLRQASSDRVSGFEYIHRACLDLVFEHIADMRDPLSDRFTHYVLAEVDCPAEIL